MTWTRLSDDFADKPSVMGLSDSAFRAHIEALVWCNKHTTNGLLPAAGLRRILSADDPNTVTAELIEADLWLDEDGSYQVDWTDQESAEDVEARRQEWARRSARQRRHNKGDHSTCDPKRCHYLLANPQEASVTRDSHRDSRSDSRPPAPDPLPSRPLGRERERGAADAAPSARATGAAHRSEGERHAWRDDEAGAGYCRTCGLPKGNAIHSDDDRPRTFTYTMPEGY